MKILVTGGAGYIGSHTVKALIKEGFEVIVYDSLENGHQESLVGGVILVEGNLSDTELLNRTFKDHQFDAVIHFAGYIEAGESMKDPLKFFQNNVAKGINLLNAMVKHNVNKIIFSSSAGVYGMPPKVPITEDMPKRPINHYGATKLIFERILEASKVYGIRSICLRYFNAAGAAGDIGEDHNPETHLIPLILQVALGKRENIKIFGSDYKTKDGSCIRDYIHVLDLADAHILALKGLFVGKEGKYNIGTGKGYSVKEIIDVSRAITKHPIPAIISERRPGDPAILVASPKKFCQEFNWHPKYGLLEIIKSAWHWHKSNPNGFN
ncbi:MAG: UDP-glucose 4-epimerase GalE [Nanoarchaeota archaeon]|nr:UDP-glucose 4-epimerase GalE [Nanoarchaeota archaeon]